MVLSKKLTSFFKSNKDKSKNDVIELMIKEFGYKRSTAKSRYSDCSNSNYSNSTGVNLKKIVFEFFDKNPYVLGESDNKTYANQLRISVVTYAGYKSQYKAEQEREKEKRIRIRLEKENQLKQEIPEYGDKYYKGRPRNKFVFDDSRL